MAKTPNSSAYSMPNFSDSLVAMLASSNTPVEKIVDEARRMSKGTEFVLMLKNQEGIQDRLLPSYLNAMIRYKDNAMSANTLGLETLLFVAGTMNIGDAIEKVSARSQSFVIFSSSKDVYQKFASKFDIKMESIIKLTLHNPESGNVAVTAIREDK